MVSVSLALALVFGLFLLTAILDPGGHDYLILILLALAPLLLFIWASAFRMERRRVTQAESEYETQLLLSDGVFNHTIEGIAITDIKGNIERVNPAFTRITGYVAEETVGKNPRILKSDRHDAGFYREMWRSLRETGQWQGEIWNRRKSGEAYPEWLAITAILNSRGETEKYVSVFHDISEIQQSREMLRFQAYHDGLTGLPNRHLFNDRLERAIAYAKRKNGRIAVLLVDLDNFKHINDSLGHPVGDEFLKKTAERMKRHCREEDTVARLGGDEFIIFNTDLGSDRDAVEVAKRIQRTFDDPILVGGHELFSTTSIGITFFPEDGKDAHTLVKNADMAMYRAKFLGKNAYALFTPALHAAASKRMDMENSLRRAVRQEDFTLFYQPKVDLAADRIVGVEALVRWFRSDGGMAPPDQFIPLAEETGLIHPLGEWVLRTACRQTRIWNETIRSDLTVAVNLSARQFGNKDLIPLVRSVLDDAGLDPSNLDLEITENMVMRHLTAAADAMERLKAMGIHISIDDFGTGYSSLSYLKRFPITLLKIDKSFVGDLPDNAEDAAIVRAILSLAHNLGLRVVAEGVETVRQLDFLRRHGCEEIQGYLFSRPVPAREMTRLLEEKGGAAGLPAAAGGDGTPPLG
jgi:diguanylate cyclase (GGDEF)-like protein/PAS domain S-box-containing protein